MINDRAHAQSLRKQYGRSSSKAEAAASKQVRFLLIARAHCSTLALLDGDIITIIIINIIPTYPQHIVMIALTIVVVEMQSFVASSNFCLYVYVYFKDTGHAYACTMSMSMCSRSPII